MYTNPEGRKTVNTLAKAVCENMPELKHHFTEVKTVMALYWAAAEAATEMEVLKSGGSAYLMKAAGTGYGDDYFYLDLKDHMTGALNLTNDTNGLQALMKKAVDKTIDDVMEPAKASAEHQPVVPRPVISLTPTPFDMPTPTRIPTPTPTPAPLTPVTPVPAYVQFKDSKFNYDGHLMLLLSTVPNNTKLQRIQEIINYNQTYDTGTGTGADNFNYLYNTYAAVEVKAKVKIGMMFLNWQLFKEANIGQEFRGGYTYEANWFQLY